jgi:hypothetical protein
MAFKKSSAIFVTLIVSAVALAIATSGALSAPSTSQNVPSGGTLTSVEASVNLGIYTNAVCTQNASFVDWGALETGESTTKVIWIKNLGNTDATLSISATDWVPANADPAINLSWNQEGRTLSPREVVQATLTLTVSESIDSSITSFNFNIRVTGTA